MPRPRHADSRARTHELLRLISAGQPIHDAAKQAGVEPSRVLRLLSDPAFFAAVAALQPHLTAAA